MKTISNIYLYSWVIYLLQGFLFGDESRIGTILLFVILLVSMFVTLKVISTFRQPLFLKGLNLLLLMFTVYGAIYIMVGQKVAPGHPVYEYLKNIYVSFLPVYCFFYFTKKGQLTSNNIRLVFFLLLLTCTGSYYIYESRKLMLLTDGTITEISNNVSYSFVAMMPMLYLFKKRMSVQLFSILYIMFFVLSSFKRGAILIAFICLLILFYQLFAKSNRIIKYRMLILMAGFVIVSAYYINYLYDTSDRFVYQIEKTEEGNSSKRDLIYSTLLNHYLDNTSDKEFLIGGGPDHTWAIYGNYAHNDWLEILTNNGLLGGVIYAIYFICFFINMRQYKKQNPFIYGIIQMAFIVLLVKTFFSMSYASVPISMSLILGYCFAQPYQKTEAEYLESSPKNEKKLKR